MSVPASLAEQITSAFKILNPDLKAVPKDPTYGQHMTYILAELNKMKTEVNSSAFGPDWSTKELAWRVKFIAQRSKKNEQTASSEAEAKLKASKDTLLAIVTPLIANMEKLGSADVQNRIVTVLQKIQQDESGKPPVKDPERPIFDPNA